MIQPVIQEETTGCGIASVANIVGKSYAEVRQVANQLGIFAADKSLWSDTQYVRDILNAYDIEVSPIEQPFVSWEALPNCALLSIKHHQEDNKNFWHWVVFNRINGEAMVLDSAAYLESNQRKDFEQMHPKWFIEVLTARG